MTLPTIISLSISANAAISVIMHRDIRIAVLGAQALADRQEVNPIPRQQPQRVYGVVDRPSPPVQPPAQHQTDLAQPGGFQEPVARRAGTLRTADSGVHEFLDDKPAGGGDAEA
jgi:hypothetical protein